MFSETLSKEVLALLASSVAGVTSHGDYHLHVHFVLQHHLLKPARQIHKFGVRAQLRFQQLGFHRKVVESRTHLPLYLGPHALVPAPDNFDGAEHIRRSD